MTKMQLINEIQHIEASIKFMCQNDLIDPAVLALEINVTRNQIKTLCGCLEMAVKKLPGGIDD